MKTIILLLLVLAAAGLANAQPAKEATKPVIFAVLNDGTTLEPIGYLVDKKIEDAIDGGGEQDVLSLFHRRYFKPKTSHQLVFGGAASGLVSIKRSDPNEECARHTAQVMVTSTRARLKGNVMALAVSSSVKVSGSGTRRAPTPAERSEIEALVRTELAKNKVPAAAARKLHYQNLTALDVNADDDVEFVGSYWVQPTAKTRSLLFLIAEKKIDGRYEIKFCDFGSIKEEDTMSSDITAVDSGVGHELLLDVLDIDDDGMSEIFTYTASFEGAGFNVYRREKGKWTRIYEGANYRCAF